MIITRRSLLTTLPATAAAVALSGAEARTRVGPDQTRSVTFTPATALADSERQRHEKYMKAALDLAESLPGPFAAVIVDRKTGKIVCQGLNKYEESIILHGEIVAITACSAERPKVAWQDLTLYTTAESCPMCQGAVVWAGIPEAVYGTSVATLDRLGIHQFRLDSPTVAAAAPFYSGRIIGGILSERADGMYRKWAESRGHR